MKKFTKLLGIVLIIALVMSMGITAAFAQTVAKSPADADNASITITNASKGDTYMLFKLFDATVTDAPATGESEGIAYTGDIPSALTAFFTKDEAGNIHVAEGKSDADVTKAVSDWAAGLDENDSHFVNQATSDGSALEFTGLPYGYYAVTTTQGATVTVDSTNPNATIVDKNSKTPSATKEVNPEHGSVGQTVTYTATFNAPNYIVNETTNKQEQVVSYVIEDTLPSFLSDVAITSVTVIQTSKEAEKATYPDVDLSSSYTSFNATTKSIEIPWVDEAVPTSDHTYTSTYKNGSQIVITYTAKITSEAAVGAGNVNTVSLKPQVDRGEGKVPFSETDKWHDDATVYTHAAALQKKAKSEDGENLAGAEFKFNGLIVTGTPGFYTVVSYDPTSTVPGTTMQCDADGKLVIAGIDADSTTPVKLVGTETKAPDGYNKLDGTFELTTTVMSSETTTTWGEKTTYYDADGNIVAEEADGGSSVERKEITAISDVPATAIQKVVNNTGAELPSTGGIGTTIFYVVGSILVVAAGVLLITKKRMSREG